MSEATMRWMRQNDLADIIQIEEQCFPFPWDQEDFNICLRKKDNVGVVLTSGENIIGYMIFQFSKKSYIILSIAVDPAYQKNGHGKQMIEYLKTKIRSSNSGPKDQIKIIVSDQNLNCHNFLKCIGFTATKVIKEYFGPDHDAYDFMLDLIAHKPKKTRTKKKSPESKVAIDRKKKNDNRVE